MDWSLLQKILLVVQHLVSFIGVMIIISGIILALIQYLYFSLTSLLNHNPSKINAIRLTLGRILILGLEFIVAADLIGTTTTPDYYSLGILAIIVIIRTILSFSLNREIMGLSKETQSISS